MNVTKEIQQNHIIYGASDYTAPHSLAGSRSLNYAEGASITKPAHQECSTIPHTFRYEDAVGLFGAENYFTKIKLDIKGDVAFACYEEEGWECAAISRDPGVVENTYDPGLVDRTAPCVDNTNTYFCPRILDNKLPSIGGNAYVSIDLRNLKTGNMYNDDWVDIRLYSITREEHPYEKMYVKLNDSFYIGIHARNTKRLPFDVSCIVGMEYLTYEAIPDKKFLMKR